MISSRSHCLQFLPPLKGRLRGKNRPVPPSSHAVNLNNKKLPPHPNIIPHFEAQHARVDISQTELPAISRSFSISRALLHSTPAYVGHFFPAPGLRRSTDPSSTLVTPLESPKLCFLWPSSSLLTFFARRFLNSDSSDFSQIHHVFHRRHRAQGRGDQARRDDRGMPRTNQATVDGGRRGGTASTLCDFVQLANTTRYIGSCY